MRSSAPEPNSPPRSEGAQISERSRVGGWPIAAAIAVIALLLYAVRYALLPFVFAAAVAFVTEPLIAAATRRSALPRWSVAALLCVVLLVAFAGAAYGLARTAAADLLQLIGNAPAIARNLLRQLLGDAGTTVLGNTYTADSLVAAAGETLKRALGFGLVAKVGGSVIGALFGLVLTLVLIPFFMVSGPRLAAGTLWLIPPERRPSVMALLPKLVPVLRRYLIGIAVVVAYTAAVAWLGFGLVAGLANAALLAVTVGVLEIVPVIGPLTAATLVGLTAVQQASLAAALALIGFVIALRLSIDNLVGPLVLGQATRLHPVVIIAAFVCGAMLFGVVGLLLAVPTAVCVKLTLEHYYAEPIRPEQH
ncbi:MAG TPA: AI-2E family transporter [Stellaceae bacterium]|nr:AI-2E family transporter [Stellaceae bacterium]